MNYKTSFINTGILRHDLKSFGWIGVVYFLGLLLSVPLQIVMIYSRQVATGVIYSSMNPNPYLQVLSFESPFQLLLWLSVPVLTGILLFRYLQSGESADLAHALPLRRETLYNTHLAAGVILLLIPIFLTSLVSWAVLQGLGIEHVTGHDILTWLGVGLIFNLLLFISSAAVGMLTGMSTVQGGLTYILLLLPTGLTLLVLQNLQHFVFGLPYDFLDNNIERLSPLLRVTNNHPFTGVETVIYLLLCIALYLLGLFLYRRRPSENAGNALAFRGLHPVLVYGVTFCAMLLLGAYFNSETQNSMGWTYFGYFLGSLLGYLVSLVLVNKSLDIFRPRAAWNYLWYSLVIVLLITGLNYDVTGYEKRIPSLASVESVYLDGSFYRLWTARGTQLPYYIEDSGSDSYRRQITMVYSDPANIAAIHELHQTMIENREIEKSLLWEYDRSMFYHCCLAYNLQNGKTVYRQYKVPIERYAAQIKPVYESQEHKKMIYDILNISPRQVDFLQVSANEVERSVKLTNPALLLQAVNALQMDARSQTYEEMTSHRPPWAKVDLLLNDGKRLRLSWEKSYVFFEEWLQDAGEYANARIMPNDVKYALIEKGPFADKGVQARVTKMSHTIDSDAYIQELESSGSCVRVTDPDKIESLLWQYTNKDDEACRVHFVLQNGTYFSAGLPQ